MVSGLPPNWLTTSPGLASRKSIRVSWFRPWSIPRAWRPRRTGTMLTLSAGQTFYESPTDVHATSKNASQTAKAKILVFMLKDKGKPGSRPAQ